jgi:undecaprenyl diphosphate synthase
VKGLWAKPVTEGAGSAGTVPRHVAIIMDGNGRWAKKRFLPRIAGHRAGAEAVRTVVRAARDFGVEALTLYAFSSENWRRSTEEVSDLMGLLRIYLRREIRKLHDEEVRLHSIGEIDGLGAELAALIREGIELTKDNKGLNFVLALNYGSQDEMVRAVRDIAAEVQAGKLPPAEIDTAAIESRLYTRDLPPLDLLIRTSGERRLSNFLLWQAAYAELLFVDTLWPDFDRQALADAIADFGTRERRFGGR